MGKYGQVAVQAARLAQKNLTPIEAWDRVCNHVFGEGSPSAKKSCPKHAFLGLCSAGKIKGIPKGLLPDSKNSEYSIKAVEIIPTLSLPIGKKELWVKVLKKIGENQDKQHNEQMDVVMSLWKEGLITK